MHFMFVFKITFKSCSGCIIFAHGDAFEAHSLITQACLISIDLYACVSYKFLLVLNRSMSNHASYHVHSNWGDAWDAYASQTQSSLISSDVLHSLEQCKQTVSHMFFTCSYLNCSIIACFKNSFQH